MEKQFIIKCVTDEDGIRYYSHMNGQSGRAAYAARMNAPRFDEAMGKLIIKQLHTLDERGWEILEVSD